MSQKLHRAPFALASDGSVLLNVTEFDGSKRFEQAVERARKEPGALFVGIRLTPRELELLLESLGDAEAEAAARMVGKRTRRERGG